MDVQSRKVVIIEDDPDASKLLRLYLKRLGYEVWEASDGETALSLIMSHKPDLVCLDLCLPQGSGFEVCEAMRSSEESANIPVLVTTGRASPQDQALAEMVGVDAYLIKPFSSDVFMDIVERLAKRDRAVVPIRPEVLQ